MKKINSLDDLLVEELSDLSNAEDQLIEVFPKIIEACESIALKTALEQHWETTKDQVKRLKDIFSHVGQNPESVTCKAIKGLIKESEDIINTTPKGWSRDATLISIGQRMERYEIAGYLAAYEHAISLGHTKMMELLDKTLDEERDMNFCLNELAQGMINLQAINKGRGFYKPEGKHRWEGIGKKSKNLEVSRFISEGNPNSQEINDKGDFS